MWPSFTSNYLASAIFLNPVLFLHSLNSLLSRILPAQITSAPLPPSRWILGPPGECPYLDVHSSDRLCWSYTAVMVFAQLFAYATVYRGREDRKERFERKRARERAAGQRKSNSGVDRDTQECRDGESKDRRLGDKDGTQTSSPGEGKKTSSDGGTEV